MINSPGDLEKYRENSRRILPFITITNKLTGQQGFYNPSNMVSMKIERTGAKDKFFGFGIGQKITLIVPSEDATTKWVKRGFIAKLQIIISDSQPYPQFYPGLFTVDDIKYNTDRTAEITLIDYVLKTNNILFKNIKDEHPSYNLFLLLVYIGQKIGCDGLKTSGDLQDTTLQLNYPKGANLSGNETLREVLDGIAEICGAIYYVDDSRNIVLKRIKDCVVPADQFKLNKSWYMNLTIGKTHSLSQIAHITELENLVSGVPGGELEFLRNNPFLDLRDDKHVILDNLLTYVKDLPRTEFSCSWKGNALLEPGDVITVADRDGKEYLVPFVNDVLTYDAGSLQQETKWEYENKNDIDNPNSTTLGEKVNQTFAKVDKANQEIQLVIKDVQGNKEAITAIELENGKIQQTVSDFEGRISTVEQTSDSITQTVNGLEGRVSTVEQTSDSITQTVNGLDGRVSSVEQTSEAITQTVNGLDGDVTSLTTDVDGVRIDINKANKKITNAQNDITSISATIDGLTVEDSKGNVLISGGKVEASDAFQVGTKGYMGGGQGMSANQHVTEGIIISSGQKPTDNGFTTNPYLIVTDAGVRLQAGDCSVTVTKNGAFFSKNKNSFQDIGSGSGGTITVKPVWGA